VKIIDAHLHFSAISKFIDAAESISEVDYSGKGLQEEFELNNIVLGIAMGLTESHPCSFPDKYSDNPMSIDLESHVPYNLVSCIGINPTALECNLREQIKQIENKLQSESVVGIKLYPGYYPYTVNELIYQTIYKLAGYHDLPVVIHCGDTFFDRGLLRYAHPLHVNQLAIKYPNVRFVIAHFGNPWVMDTGIILSNNANVFADLSGLFLGDEELLTKKQQNTLIMNHIRTGILYSEHYDKILFGSD
jgi:predicted TIM-barrel fold metal-dependent hydrolase